MLADFFVTWLDFSEELQQQHNKNEQGWFYIYLYVFKAQRTENETHVERRKPACSQLASLSHS